MTFLCQKLGKRRSFLVDVRNGNDRIDGNELKIIADELNTTIEYLTDQTEVKEKPPAETDGELDPEVEEVLDLLFAMHPDDRKQLLDYAQWLATQREGKA